MTNILVVALLVIASVLGGSYYTKRAFLRDSQSLAYYERTMLHKQGFAMGFGSYELRSFDGGKLWYAVERGENGAVIIKGTADEVFPGLLKHLDAMDALVEYAKKNGPLTLSGARATDDRSMLENAGFVVSDKR